jgi:hypothetical protein
MPLREIVLLLAFMSSKLINTEYTVISRLDYQFHDYQEVISGIIDGFSTRPFAHNDTKWPNTVVNSLSPSDDDEWLIVILAVSFARLLLEHYRIDLLLSYLIIRLNNKQFRDIDFWISYYVGHCYSIVGCFKEFRYYFRRRWAAIYILILRWRVIAPPLIDLIEIWNFTAATPLLHAHRRTHAHHAAHHRFATTL